MSKNSDSTKKAVAMSVGTCLVLGVIAFEVVRSQNLLDKKAPQEEPERTPITLLANPEDSRMHRDLSELEAKINRTERLLFSRDHALENARMKAVREKLAQKAEYVLELEDKNEQLKKEIESARAKLAELEKTTSAFISTIEMQKNIKTADENKLRKEFEQLNQLHSQELAELNQRIQELYENERALKDALERRDTALTEVQAKTALQLVTLQEMADKAVATAHHEQNFSKNLKTVAEDLKLEVERLEEQLRDHEQTDVSQQRDFAAREMAMSEERQRLRQELYEMKTELEAQINKYQLEVARADELEESLKTLITKSAEREQELSEQVEKHQHALTTQHILFDELSNDANQLREKLATIGNDHEAIQERLKDKIADYEALQVKNLEYHKALEDQLKFSSLTSADLYDQLLLGTADAKRLAILSENESAEKRKLEKELSRLQEDLSINQKLAGNVQAELDQKIAELTELTTTLRAEKQEALDLAKRYQFQEPIRDLTKEDEYQEQILVLNQNLTDLRQASYDLEEKLKNEKALVRDLAYKLENQEPIRDTAREEELSKELVSLWQQNAELKKTEEELKKITRELDDRLQAELQTSAELAHRLENQKPIRDLAREEALEKELQALQENLAQEQQLVNELILLSDSQEPIRETTSELKQQIKWLEANLESEKQIVDDLTTRLDTMQPVRDIAKEQVLQRQIDELKTLLDSAPKEDTLVEMDRLKQEIVRLKQRYEYDLFHNGQKELSYKEQIRELKESLERKAPEELTTEAP